MALKPKLILIKLLIRFIRTDDNCCIIVVESAYYTTIGMWVLGCVPIKGGGFPALRVASSLPLCLGLQRMYDVSKLSEPLKVVLFCLKVVINNFFKIQLID